jgi:hypothetical protein
MAAIAGVPTAVVLIVVGSLGWLAPTASRGDDGRSEAESACGRHTSGVEAPLPPELSEIQGADLEVLRERIAEIDRAFTSNDPERLKGVLANDASGARRALECEFKHAVGNANVLSQRTEIKKALRIDTTDAVYAAVTTSLRPKPSKDVTFSFDRSVTRGMVLFFRPGPKGLVLGRVEAWDVEQTQWLTTPEVTCAACGWRFKRPTGWFVVPRDEHGGSSFDTVSFVHPGLRVSIDFDCYSNPSQQSPMVMAERDQEVLNQIMGFKGPSVSIVGRREVSDEKGEKRAELAVEVGGVGSEKRKLRFERVYRFIPPFMYAFVVRSDAEDVDASSTSPRAIIESLEMTLAHLGPSERLDLVAKAHMCQSRLLGGQFVDEKLGITFDGPAGWNVAPQPGVGRFCVRFTPPSDPTGNESSTAFTALAWEGEARCYGETEIARFFENRRASMWEAEYRDWKVLRREAFDHPNGVDVAYRMESQWRRGEACGAARAGIAMRELYVVIPSGRYLLQFVARAPSEEFENRRAEFDQAIASLRHSLPK